MLRPGGLALFAQVNPRRASLDASGQSVSSAQAKACCKSGQYGVRSCAPGLVAEKVGDRQRMVARPAGSIAA